MAKKYELIGNSPVKNDAEVDAEIGRQNSLRLLLYSSSGPQAGADRLIGLIEHVRKYAR